MLSGDDPRADEFHGDRDLMEVPYRASKARPEIFCTTRGLKRRCSGRLRVARHSSLRLIL